MLPSEGETLGENQVRPCLMAGVIFHIIASSLWVSVLIGMVITVFFTLDFSHSYYVTYGSVVNESPNLIDCWGRTNLAIHEVSDPE